MRAMRLTRLYVSMLCDTERSLTYAPDERRGGRTPVSACLRFDLHKNTGRYLNAIDRFDRTGCGLTDIDDAFVRAHLELLSRFLVHMRTAKNGESLNARGKRHGTMNLGTGALGLLYDLLSRRVQCTCVVRFHPNSDSSATAHVLNSSTESPNVNHSAKNRRPVSLIAPHSLSTEYLFFFEFHHGTLVPGNEETQEGAVWKCISPILPIPSCPSRTRESSEKESWSPSLALGIGFGVS